MNNPGVLLIFLLLSVRTKDDKNLLEEISKAEEEYKYGKCIHLNCFKLRLGRDLSHFQDGFGIEDLTNVLNKYGAVHYQIIDHQLYRTTNCFISSRCESIDKMLLNMINDLNDTEFLILSDIPGIQARSDKAPLFAHCKLKKNFDVLFPEWSFYEGGPVIPEFFPDGVGDWKNYKKKLDVESQKISWENKLDKAYFRGSRKTSNRDTVMGLTMSNPNLYDAKYVKNQAWRTLKDSGGFEPVDYESPLKACKYKYLLDLGTSGCSARTRHSLMCKSVVLRPHDGFEEFWTFSLKPWIHYVPINYNNSDVEEKLEFIRSHPEIAKKIAIRGYEFVQKNLEMKHIYDYWKLLLQEYWHFVKWPVVKHNKTKLVVPGEEFKTDEL